MVSFTHRGWYLFCPVYTSDPKNLDDFHVVTRSSWLEWWFDVNHFLLTVLLGVYSVVFPQRELVFPFTITGKLDNPLTFHETR